MEEKRPNKKYKKPIVIIIIFFIIIIGFFIILRTNRQVSRKYYDLLYSSCESLRSKGKDVNFDTKCLNPEFDAETICADKRQQVENIKTKKFEFDKITEEYIEAWKKLLVHHNETIFDRSFIDENVYIDKTEIVDVNNEKAEAEKYFEVHYYIIHDWRAIEKYNRFTIKYKNQEQLNGNEVFERYKDTFANQGYLVDTYIQENRQSAMSTLINNIKEGKKSISCEEAVERLNDSCPTIKFKRTLDSYYMTFKGEKNAALNQCGKGSVDLLSGEVACKGIPCQIE